MIVIKHRDSEVLHHETAGYLRNLTT